MTSSIMKPKFISNKSSIDSYDIVVLHGKVYEFYRDGNGKLIQSQDINDINIQQQQGKSCGNKIFQIKTSQPMKNLVATTTEKIISDLNDLEYLKARLKILLSELDKRCSILRKNKFEMTGIHDTNKEITSSISGDLSISMPILSPQLQKYTAELSLEKLNVTLTSSILQNGINCKTFCKKSKKNAVNHSKTHGSNSSDLSMPTLSPYYKTPIGSFSNQQSLLKKIKNNCKLLQKTTKSKLTSIHSCNLEPVVCIEPLSKSVLAKYSVNILHKSTKRKLGPNINYTAAKRSKNANSSSEFIDSPNFKKMNKDNKCKSKHKNRKFTNKGKDKILPKNKKSIPSKSKIFRSKPNSSPKKSNTLSKTVKSAALTKISNMKKKSSTKTKKLIMSSSLWINRDNGSSSSSSELHKSPLVDSDNSFSKDESKAAAILSSPSSDSDMCSIKNIHGSSNTNSDFELLVLSDSDEIGSRKIIETDTELLTPNQSPCDSTNYFTPPENNVISKS